MACSGWQVNLSGQKIPIYKMNDNGSCSSTRIRVMRLYKYLKDNIEGIE